MARGPGSLGKVYAQRKGIGAGLKLLFQCLCVIYIRGTKCTPGTASHAFSVESSLHAQNTTMR